MNATVKQKHYRTTGRGNAALCSVVVLLCPSSAAATDGSQHGHGQLGGRLGTGAQRANAGSAHDGRGAVRLTPLLDPAHGHPGATALGTLVRCRRLEKAPTARAAAFGRMPENIVGADADATWGACLAAAARTASQLLMN